MRRISFSPAGFCWGGGLRLRVLSVGCALVRAGFRVSGFGGLVSLGLRVWRVSASGSEFGVLGL